MKYWPKWLRITFIVAGGVFVVAVLFSAYVLTTYTVVPPLSTAVPEQPGNPEPPRSQPTNIVNYITAITGLVTAASGLYGKILEGQKQRMDYELAKRQMEMRGQSHNTEPNQSVAPKKTNRKRKKR